MRIRTWLGLAVAVGALAPTGCGPSNGLTMGRVSGRVTYNGEPVEFGEVLFVPDSEKGNTGVPSMGVIGKDGRYTMSTQDPDDGVIAGYHKVGIRALDPEQVTKDGTPAPEPENAPAPTSIADRISKRKAQSVKMRKNRAKEDAPTVTFNGRTFRFLAPEKVANPNNSGISVQISRGSNRVDFAIQEDGTVKVSH
jgi:hypothetical protein